MLQPLGGWSIAQPLFEQQGGRGAVESATAITVQAEALAGGPAAAVFVHPRQRQRFPKLLKRRRQAQAVATAMAGLGGGLAGRIQGQADHQGLHPALAQQREKPREVLVKVGALQSGQRRDREAEGITTRQADAAVADIKGQG